MFKVEKPECVKKTFRKGSWFSDCTNMAIPKLL